MIYRTTLYLLSAALTLGFSQSAYSAGAEPIVVTATKIATPLRQIGSSVSVLTKDDIDRQGSTFTVDALRALPGVSVTENGGPGGLASVKIRGEEAYRTLILIDGIRVSDAAAPQVATNLTSALASDVGRIEVVRGPQSLLYGADAVGGIIQIMTPEPEPGLAVAGEAAAGAYRTRTASGAFLYGGHGWSGSLQGSYYKSGGFSAKEGDPALDDADGLKASATHAKADIDLSPNFHFEAVGRYAMSDAGFDGASAFPPLSPADPNRLMKTRESAGRFEIQNTADEGRMHTAVSYIFSATARDDLSNGLPFAFGSKFDGTRDRLGILSTIEVSPKHSILFGADQETLSVTTDTSSGKSSGYGVYGEWQGTFSNQFFMTLGGRFDHGDTFGDHLSGRGTAAFLFALLPAETSRLHASYGTGFRAPSLYEQATNRNAALPVLKEEESRGFDAGLGQSFYGGDVTLDVTYFDQAITNEIRFDNVAFTGYFQSLGRSQSRGVEASLHAEHKIAASWLNALRLDIAYTYTDARVHSPDAENGLPRVRRPRHMSNTALSFLFAHEHADLTLSIRTAEDTQDGFREFRTRLDDYAVLDVAARARVSPHVELFIKGVNVTDEQYEEVAGYATSDAAVYAGIRLHP